MSYNPNIRGDQLSVTVDNTGGGIDNDSGATIIKATPVRIDGNGNIKPINVSMEVEALAVVGVALENIVNGTSGPVITSGKIENIVTTANNGDVLYVSKTGGLTNTKPNIGVGGFIAGDFVIRIGTLFKNVSNPAQQDLLLNVTMIGQL